ncbi:uncharacterized protein LOC142322591 [Lycorma delicatula]|uniref:uncharacterized protein LOC142322591 n=1 Tax=Lycorma delicatula TaxID=130591 RepID=UPI003F50FBF5
MDIVGPEDTSIKHFEVFRHHLQPSETVYVHCFKTERGILIYCFTRSAPVVFNDYDVLKEPEIRDSKSVAFSENNDTHYANRLISEQSGITCRTEYQPHVGGFGTLICSCIFGSCLRNTTKDLNVANSNVTPYKEVLYYKQTLLKIQIRKKFKTTPMLRNLPSRIILNLLLKIITVRKLRDKFFYKQRFLSKPLPYSPITANEMVYEVSHTEITVNNNMEVITNENCIDNFNSINNEENSTLNSQEVANSSRINVKKFKSKNLKIKKFKKK